MSKFEFCEYSVEDLNSKPSRWLLKPVFYDCEWKVRTRTNWSE